MYNLILVFSYFVLFFWKKEKNKRTKKKRLDLRTTNTNTNTNTNAHRHIKFTKMFFYSWFCLFTSFLLAVNCTAFLMRCCSSKSSKISVVCTSYNDIIVIQFLFLFLFWFFSFYTQLKSYRIMPNHSNIALSYVVRYKKHVILLLCIEHKSIVVVDIIYIYRIYAGIWNILTCIYNIFGVCGMLYGIL